MSKITSDTVTQRRRDEVQGVASASLRHCVTSSRRLSAGFTLIELLVVVTIIVVLLALLAPAMDKAIYQAQLAMCGTQQRGIGSGVITYAMANKRTYPYAPDGRGWNYHTDLIGWEAYPREDLRPLLADYMNVSIFACPLTQKIAVDTGSNGTGTQVHSTYDLWFGWQFQVNGSHAPMRRIGDRFTYTPPNGETSRFNLLTSDVNIFDQTSPGATGWTLFQPVLRADNRDTKQVSRP